MPDRFWVREDEGYVPVVRADDPDRWRRCVYSDIPLVVQVEDPPGTVPARVPSSSASMPRIVAAMLGCLKVGSGHSVLEIGTGTGYNAALLSARLGDEKVTTVEVDPGLADRARRALRAAGHEPAVVTGDGARGWPRAAPYDRLIATCAVHRVPYAWVEQTAPGGIIVVPWGTALHNGVLLQLTVHHGVGGPVARGPVVEDSAFMWLRAQTPLRDVMSAVRHAPEAVVTRTRLDPRYPLGDTDAAFAVGVMVPGVSRSIGHGPDGEWTLWLADAATGSWASLDYVPEARDFEVQQYGPRALWAEVERAYRWWTRAGSPQRTRYGLTVTAEGQRVWLDRPDSPVPELPSESTTRTRARPHRP
ncbi:methyltransferase domain-containing protein [Streptomyces sp. NPDC050610]|uniref:methyltransferase domain-containing protein n=1 Tax=Streptomyces sp. NPDC050610 TaxID=3157097 RepID=UPI00341BFE64